MNNKPEQAQRFLAALTGTPSPSLTWQRFCDFDKTREDLATWWHGPQNDVKLNDSQLMGCGVFYCVNGASNGGRKMADVDIFRAVFMDSDGAPLPQNWPVAPHALIMRDETHYHAYWFIDGDTDSNEWRYAQKQIALHFGSDETMVNPDRVMRVPGYTHMKDLSNQKVYEFTYLNDQLPRYKLRDILPYFTLTDEKMTKLADWVRQRSGIYLNEAADYDDREANQIKYRDYLTKRAEHSIQGQEGNKVAFKTAAAGRDYGLSPEKTYEMMLQLWDIHSVPPWGDELQGVIRNAYTYNQNKLGSRSLGIFLDEQVHSLAGMSTQPVQAVLYVQESDAVQENKEKVDAMAKVAEIRAATAPGQVITPDLSSAFYGKNHTQNAVAFLSTRAPNGEIILSEEDIYIYNGKVFESKPTKYLNGVLAREMEFLAPSTADVDGSVNMIKNHLMNDSPQKWPEWKCAPDRDTSGVIVFNNGILDIMTNEWFDHTPMLRARNVLPFDYDNNAQCPTWERLLWTQWGDTKYEPLIDLLQLWFGYMLSDDQSQQKMAFFIGKPRSGKGTMMRVLEGMLGSYNCASPSIEGLNKDSNLHSISDKMVAIFNDVADPAPSARNSVVAAIKRIVGQDSVMFDRKYKSAMTTRFKCRLNFTCNAIPNLAESSTAMLNRGLFFYTPKSFAGMENTDLDEQLQNEMSGIINWAIRGLQRLRAGERLVNEKCMDDRINVFRMVTSPLEVFVDSQMSYREDAYVPVADVFTRYRAWAATNDGGGIKSLGAFSRMMDAMADMEMSFTSDRTPVLMGVYLKPLEIDIDGDIPA